MKSLPFLFCVFGLASISCERHEFQGPNGTKQLHEHHGAGHDDHADHGDHGAKEGHEAKDDHGHAKPEKAAH